MLVCLCILFVSCKRDEKPSQDTTVTVNFVNWDGSLLKVATVTAGTAPVFDGETPQRESDDYQYTFVGWTSGGQTYTELPAVDKNTVFTAEYSRERITYVITFSVAGTTTSVRVGAGEIPVFTGKTEFVIDGILYTIVGWDREFSAACADVTYTAVLQMTPGTNVVFCVEDERLELPFRTGAVPRFYGTPYKPAAAHSTFEFSGWVDGDGVFWPVGTDLPPVGSEEVVYTAQFMEHINSYSVTFKDSDGSVLAVISAGYGSTPQYAGQTPEKPSDQKYSYNFRGWTDGENVYDVLPPATSNATYKAVYTETLNVYTLTINYSHGDKRVFVDSLPWGDNYYVASPAVDGRYPDKPCVSGVIVGDVTVDVTYVQAAVWDGSVSTSLTTAPGGSGEPGSQSNPYLITSGADLAFLSEESIEKDYGEGKYYLLNNDIDLNNIDWRPICKAKGTTWNYFLGNFDGQGHTIYNLKVSTKYKTAGVGLFGGVKGVVKNLTITGSISAQNRIGAVCYVLDGGTVYNVNTYVDIESTETSSTGAYIGGIVGMARNGFVIENCNNYGSVSCLTATSNGSKTGGVLGNAFGGTVRNCNNYGAVSSYRWVGGIAGYFSDSSTFRIDGCCNYAHITGIANGVGGVFGFAENKGDGSITGCRNYAPVSGTNYTGGIVGWTRSMEVSSCGNIGYVKGNTYVGGIAGAASDMSVVDCFNGGLVSGYGTSTGGIAGMLEVETKSNRITDCRNYGKIINSSQGTTTAVGGIAGSIKAKTIGEGLVSPTVENCFNDADITGYHNFVGGIVGACNGGRVLSCANSGKVMSRSGVYVGGIAGSNYGYGYVSGCTNRGDIFGTGTVGQICGQLTDTSSAENNLEKGSAVVLQKC